MNKAFSFIILETFKVFKRFFNFQNSSEQEKTPFWEMFLNNGPSVIFS